MAHIHPIVSAMKQIKGDTPQAKQARLAILVERKVISDIYLNKKSKKKILKLIA